MSDHWPSYQAWSVTCDTLHAHVQVIGKLATKLAAPEPRFQHAALRLSARGWESMPLRAPNGSGMFVAGLDLRRHEAFVEHSRGGRREVSLTPNRPVAAVTRELLEAVRSLAGVVAIDPTPAEVWWTTPLDQDEEHHSYDTDAVEAYFTAATDVALALAAFRAPYTGLATPVNAWWGSFDLAVNLLAAAPLGERAPDGAVRHGAGASEGAVSGPIDAREVSVGWWPGDPKYPRAALYAYIKPAPEPGADVTDRSWLEPTAARWDEQLGEYILDWVDVRAGGDSRRAMLDFARSVFSHARASAGWDPAAVLSPDA